MMLFQEASSKVKRSNLFKWFCYKDTKKKSQREREVCLFYKKKKRVLLPTVRCKQPYVLMV
jgi:hypothetical protein